ncbi:lipoyl synthase [Zhaonella formicivorans]|uniref:lipoyl synthase n=1 Tax=Zhaonella formicivorans TaxID=2528593 RepID=UPI0010DA0484|nr:lipoyl synthase [Zhaonella formicivorans]
MPSRFPAWMKRKLPASANIAATKEILEKLGLNTVCQSAICPNMGECFANKTATFMILGNVCTRNCRFCAVEGGHPAVVNPQEAENVAEAAKQLGLRHVVVTSVTRDDLPDGGAGHFAATITAIRKKLPKAVIEVLTPDFKGDETAIKTVTEAKPHIFNHNIETVPRLYPSVRPRADYRRSLNLLDRVKHYGPGIFTKSGLMVGLGESNEEVLQTLQDLRSVGCDIVTIGQYLQPSRRHLEVHEYVSPETFAEYKAIGESLGFKYVASAPFVRSSFNAREFSELYMMQSS